jgi:hypothetical protein
MAERMWRADTTLARAAAKDWPRALPFKALQAFFSAARVVAMRHAFGDPPKAPELQAWQ